MIKRHAMVIASVSGIFGLMMGVLGTEWGWLQSTAEVAKLGAVAKTEGGIVAKVELLQRIRAARYDDATRLLEVWLDNDLAGAGELARDGAEFSSDTVSAVETERMARRMSGYEPANVTLSVEVQQAFRLLSHAESTARPISLVSRDDSEMR
jgi:hypothetical protein